MINKPRDLLYKAGIFDDGTQLLGQYKPDTYKRYIEVHLEYTGIHSNPLDIIIISEKMNWTTDSRHI